MIVLNGQPTELAGLSVTELLSRVDAPETGVAVALNGQVVPRSLHLTLRVRDGDVVDVVTAVQGG